MDDTPRAPSHRSLGSSDSAPWRAPSHRPRERHGSSEPASARYAALEVALDLLDLNARSELQEGDSYSEEVHLLGPREVAQGQAETNPEVIAGPRLTERYKAVEGMLHFLDAQAEHRCECA